MEKEELLKKVDRYGNLKQQENQLKKEADILNKEIKTYMGENNLDTLEGTSFIASYTLRKKEDIDENKLLDLFHNEMSETALQLGIIKTKEYIDMDVVEKEIYSGNIDKELQQKMATCKIIKRTPTLTIKKGE